MKKLSLFITLISLASLGFNQSSEVKVPMQEKFWEFPEGTVKFLEHKSVPALKILPDAGKVVAKDVEFSIGTIEFDLEVDVFPFVGISFHRQSNMEEEWFYFRPYTAGDPQAFDAIQYTPIVKGVVLWDLYPQYQGPANYQKNEWIHVKLVIGPHQMYAFVNESEQPSLRIPFLEGSYKSGGIAFGGEAIFANLVLRHGVTEDLPDLPGPDPTANDSRYIRNWEVTEPTSFPMGREVYTDPISGFPESPGVIDSDIPDKETEWTPLKAEREGLVNLSREFGRVGDGRIMPRRIVWLKTTIQSAKEQTRKLSLGFSDEVWVLINGQLLYVDKNYYQRPIMKVPRGRCSIENTTIDVPLQEGDNEIMIGVGNFFWGWGVVARWDGLEDIILQ